MSFNKFMKEINSMFDYEKIIEKRKQRLKDRIDKLKRIRQTKQDLDKLEKELENLKDGKDTK